MESHAQLRQLLEPVPPARLEQGPPPGADGHLIPAGLRPLRRLMRRAVAARQALADTDAALRRVARGAFGWCEDCSAEISASNLLSAPETRYCQGCAAY